MKLTKGQKQEVSKQLAEVFKNSSHLYFTAFQGLKFIELAQLRAKLRPLSAKYQVVKNRIVGHALKEAGISGVDAALLKGPVGLIVGKGTDPVSAAKVLQAFAKDFPLLKVRAGYVDSKWLSSQDCVKLSTLGTKPELLASLAGTLYNTVSQTAGVLQAPIRDLALAIKAVADKKGSEAPAAA